MPKYQDELTEHLNELELARLKMCLKGDKDLMLDFPDLYERLYDYYSVDMPYGTAKARTGDPDAWILEAAGAELESREDKNKMINVGR